MVQKDPYDMTKRLEQLEKAWPMPTPEMEARCRRILEANDALDVAPMLGLS